MTFQIPKKFELYDRTWHVKPFTAAAKKRLAKRDKIPLSDYEDVPGLCCAETGVIYIERGRMPEAMVRTFFHELGHAIVDHSGLQIRLPVEEAFVEAMGMMLQQFLKSKSGTFG